MGWDRTEKIYGLLMYISEALAILVIIIFAISGDLRFGICAVLFTIVTSTLHIMLLVYHRTRDMPEKLKIGKEEVG